MYATLTRVTQHIIERSASCRALYEKRTQAQPRRVVHRGALDCGNLAHGFTACSAFDKQQLKLTNSANLGIVTSYNDMLSAHQPFERFPDLIRDAVRRASHGLNGPGGRRAGHV